MAGEIDFAQSLQERVALLKGLPLQVLEEVYEKRLALNPGSERLLAELKRGVLKPCWFRVGLPFYRTPSKKAWA